jgi:inosose dehydratase
MISRREFLAGAAAAGVMRAARYQPKLMLQPYVWTQVFQKEKIPLGDGLERMFAASRRAGYSRIELMDAFLTPELRSRTADLAQQYDFEVPVVYQGGTFHEPEAAERSIAGILTTADSARDLHTEWINTNCNPKKGRERKSDSELATEARYLNRLGQHLKERGMRLMLHEHDPDMADGAREWRSNLHHTDPKLLWFCVDTHWVYRGKQDPMELLDEAGRRIASLHVRNSINGVWSESFGDGDVDYRAVASFLQGIGYQGLIAVELAYENGTNPTRPLEEDLRISREYAEKIFLRG